MKNKQLFKSIHSTIDIGLKDLSMNVDESNDMTLQAAYLDLKGEWEKFGAYLKSSGYEYAKRRD